MSNVIKIESNVNKLSLLIDVLSAIERANAIVESVDVTLDTAVVVGQALSGLNFQLTSMGYVCRLGPNKTHLFMEVK